MAAPVHRRNLEHPRADLPARRYGRWLREGTSAPISRRLLAGVVVGIVALPLAMALAIGVGVAPQHALHGDRAGALVAALAGRARR